MRGLLACSLLALLAGCTELQFDEDGGSPDGRTPDGTVVDAGDGKVPADAPPPDASGDGGGPTGVTVAWAERIGGAGSQRPRAVEAGSSGVWVVGRFGGELQWQGGSADSGTADDGFVARLDRAGSLQGLETLGTDHRVELDGLALVGPDVQVAGSFSGALGFGVLDTPYDTSDEGRARAGFVWTLAADRFAGTAVEIVDDDGDEALHGLLRTGDTTYVAGSRTATELGLVLLCYGDGCSVPTATAGNGQGWALAAAGAATTRICMAGDYKGEGFLAADVLDRPLGVADAFVACFDASSTPHWGPAIGFGGDGYDRARGVAMDGAGRAFVAGHTPGFMRDGVGCAAAAMAGTMGMLVSIDLEAEALTHALCLDSGGANHVEDVVLHDGFLYVAGRVGGPTDFGDGVLREFAGETDAFVAKYAFDPASGFSLEWARVFGGPEADYALALAGHESRIYAVGELRGTVGFGDCERCGPFTADSVDGFLLALEER